MKKIIVFILLMLACQFAVNAQMYYFMKSGSDLSSKTSIKMVYINGLEGYMETKSASVISGKLYSDPTYWEDYMEKAMKKKSKTILYKYDSSLSTASYDVYRKNMHGADQVVFPGSTIIGSIIGYYYLGIGSDGKTIVTWEERKNTNNVINKTYWEIIDVNTLNQNPHDFLR